MRTVVLLELTICRRPILFEHNCTSCSEEKKLYCVRAFTYALCRPALYCLRYLLLLHAFGHLKSMLNVSQTVRKWFGNRQACLLIRAYGDYTLVRAHTSAILPLTQNSSQAVQCESWSCCGGSCLREIWVGTQWSKNRPKFFPFNVVLNLFLHGHPRMLP